MDDQRAQVTGDLLETRYIPLSQAVLWDRNPKRHDIGALVEAIKRYGFTDPSKFDAQLGAFSHGNGRAEALMWMQAHHEVPPRGVGVLPDGEWCMPVLFGVDAASRAQAEAYGIDHNNLTMSGGDFGPSDLARMWDSDYAELLEELAELDTLPETVDGDDLDALLNAEFGMDTYDMLDGIEDIGQDADGPASLRHEARYPLAVVLTRAQREVWEQYKAEQGTTNDTRAFLALMGMQEA